MAWRVARSLDVLLGQLNAIAPKRSRASDGSIGDAAHAAQGSDSDHNPWVRAENGDQIVTARDFTHDPANGLDCQVLADALIRSRDPRIKYIIWRGQICDSRPQFSPWKWTPSSGHFQHLHLSVVSNWQADLSTPWKLWENQEDGLSAEDAQNAVNGVLFNTKIVGPKGQTPYNLNDMAYWNNVMLNDLAKTVPAMQAQIVGLSKAVELLAANATDPDAIAEAVRDAIEEGVVRVQVSVQGPGTAPDNAS